MGVQINVTILENSLALLVKFKICKPHAPAAALVSLCLTELCVYMEQETGVWVSTGEFFIITK